MLAIETSTARIGCALADEGGVIAAFGVRSGQRHAEILTPAIQQLCRLAGVPPAAFDLVAVGVGPGLFTGLRVGIATGQAIAGALGVPMVAVGSLDALAHGARLATGRVLAVLDARRSEVFWAWYEASDGQVRRSSEVVVSPPETLAAELAGRADPTPPVLVVGDGARRYGASLGLGGAGGIEGRDLGVAGVIRADSQLAYPTAEAVAELAQVEAAEGRTLPAGGVRPFYVRAPDAAAHWQERAGVVGGGG